MTLKPILEQTVGQAIKPLKRNTPNLKQEKSENKGANFNDIHRVIMMFKAWLRGMHHSVMHLQDYIDEYAYRFNRSFMKENIFDNLLSRAVGNETRKQKGNVNQHRLSA